MRSIYLVMLIGGLVITGGGIYAMLSGSAMLPKRLTPSTTLVAPLASDAVPDRATSPGAKKDPTAAEKDTLGTMPGDIAALQEELRRLKDEVAALRASAKTAATGNNDQLPSTPQDMEILAEEQAYRTDQRHRKVSAIFRAEPVDAGWSNQTADLIMDAFDQADPEGSALSSIDCRSSLCRVEVDGAAGGSGLQLSHEVNKALPRKIYFYEPRQDGTTNTVIYMVREGYDPPTTL